MQQWLQYNYFNLIPKDATVEGHVHSHPWTDESNYTFSNTNKAGKIKDKDDEQIMGDPRNSKYTFYLYNALGEVRARRPATYENQNPHDEIIAYDLPWDPDATIPGTDGKKKMGPYPAVGHAKETDKFIQETIEDRRNRSLSPIDRSHKLGETGTNREPERKGHGVIPDATVIK
jgi:hypothetical protein